MKKIDLTLPEVMVLAGTRVALGAGLALLVAESVAPRKRNAAGWALFLFGAATTVPLLQKVLGNIQNAPPVVVEKTGEV